MRKILNLILLLITGAFFSQNLFASDGYFFEVVKNGQQITVTYGEKPIQYISWEDKSDPSVVLTTFFISYLEKSDFWKKSITNLGLGGASRENVLSEMEEKYEAFYGLVDRLTIKIDPEKIQVLDGSEIDTIERAYFTIKITYLYQGEEDSGEDEVLMIKDKITGDWYVAQLPL